MPDRVDQLMFSLGPAPSTAAEPKVWSHWSHEGSRIQTLHLQPSHSHLQTLPEELPRVHSAKLNNGVTKEQRKKK